MARSSKNDFALCVAATIAAVAGIGMGYVFHNPVYPVLLLLPAAIYEIVYVDEPTSAWSKWGLFICINLEAYLIAANIRVDVSEYLVKFVSDLPMIDMRMAVPVLIAYFSYITARKTKGAYTRWIGILMLACSMNLFYLVDSVLKVR